MNRILLAPVFAAAALLSCAQDAPHAQRGIADLKAVAGCSELLVELKAQALAQMNERIDANLAQALKYRYCGHSNGGEERSTAMDFGTATPSAADGAASGTTGTSGATQYSTTNNQVAGVDEADFIKNDATYLYLVGDQAFQIVQAWPAESAHVVSRTAVEGEAKQLLVGEGMAVVFSSLPRTTQTSGSWSYQPRACTYGYDCEFTGDGNPLLIEVFDIHDVTKPERVREMRFSGSLLAARRIGRAIHAVVSFQEGSVSGLSYWTGYNDPCGEDGEFVIQSAFEGLRAKNARLIEDADLSTWLPTVQDLRFEDGQTIEDTAALARCKGFYLSRQSDGASMMTVLSFDVGGKGELATSTAVGRPGAVYASGESLYIASRHAYRDGWAWFYGGAQAGDEASTVHKYELASDPPGARYAGSGVVKGHVLNQFSMDEKDGYLRIATSNGRVPSPDVTSAVTVLEPTRSGLEAIGRIDGIAPHEDIRAVRFVGERGFVVTFKKTDPLFTLDLSDPRAPRIAGELQIPGFSTYLHPMDATHLMSVGFDAEDHGNFAYFQGLQLQIFDVADLANPQLVQKTVIGTRGSTSEAATDHLAFNYFPVQGLLALPMAVCDGSQGGGTFGATLTFGGLMVFRATAAEGFEYLGGVSHEDPETPTTFRNACTHWWSDATTHVKRSVFMDDFVFSVARDQIRVERTSALGQTVAVVSLTQP